jgi:ectoine hydroxylase-related dioxygenase (phytanoyl-CoA dioxygenase family)
MLPILRWGRGGAWTTDDEAPGEGEARAPAVVLGAADELAAEGRYVEAMHVLLLQGLADIRARLDEQFADSLTSREILRSTKLSDAGRTSLRDIINRVEWTYFGEHPAALPDYVACRASFNALATALHGGVPA